MPDLQHLLSGARVLLVAPHPDDESLATGGLIQHALQRGATLRIVQVTDGDNNPWPQRWLERRWRIGPAERQRWGERRAKEMLNAMHCLGLDSSARRRLGWPDLGVTTHLQSNPERAIGSMHALLHEEQPDVLVLPSLTDAHPDHSASHVLMRLALQRLNQDMPCLTYHEHGHNRDAGPPLTLSLDAAMQAAKRRAISAHRSQIVLAGRRLPERAGPTETFHWLASPTATPRPIPHRVLLPWQPPASLLAALKLTLAHPAGCMTWHGHKAPWVRDAQGFWLELPEEIQSGPLFARLELRHSLLWIFDHWGWCDLTEAVSSRQASA